MQDLADIQLAQLPLESTEFAAEPLRYIEAARDVHPWLAISNFGYVVHEFGAMKDLLRMDESLRVPLDGVVDVMGARGTPWGRFLDEQMLNLSGEAHQKLRGPIAHLFTPRQANENRTLMRAKMNALLDEWAPKGAFDFEEFASFYPISVMCAIIGAPQSVIPEIKSSLEALGLALAMDKTQLPVLQNAVLHMEDFARKLVDQRRANQSKADKPDLLDVLIDANGAGAMSDTELNDLLINLFVAGYDTSKNILTLTMSMMLDRPDVYERCAVDFDYCQRMIDEALRFRSSTSVIRQVTQNIVYRDVRLPKGALIWFTIPMAGRDQNAFEDADEFDPERKRANHHMAFGRGAHICLGQFIARAQIEEGFHLIAQRLQNPRLTGPFGFRPFLGAGGLKGLPIAFDPA